MVIDSERVRPRPVVLNNMNSNPFQRALVLFGCAIALGITARADVVETKNGARIVGKIVRIAEGSIAIETEYAGTLAIKQNQVTSVTTDAPIAVRLAKGRCGAMIASAKALAVSSSLTTVQSAITARDSGPDHST